MPAGTLLSVQFMRAPGYIQVSGQFNQVGINLAPNDTGVCPYFFPKKLSLTLTQGELDPHGADLVCSM
jgi:hypothetical protein